MEILFLFALIPFVLPVVSLVLSARQRSRIQGLETLVEIQQQALQDVQKRLGELRKELSELRAAAPPAPPAPRVEKAPEAVAPAAREKAPEAAAAPAPAPRPNPAPAPVPTPTPVPPAPPKPSPVVAPPPRATPPPRPPTMSPPPPPPPSPPSLADRLDWEQFVGVKLFSGIAGFALVLAAVFFLRYSIDHGWLQPPVRVVIGILSGIALLVVCELRVARQYAVTANAMDAAGIAILFATIFAAHALWELIPGSAAFALLAMVTAVAVLLSIRRESLFIAVLGLLGGFATPTLLSTGENRPIPLFAYLLLLNVGLAWVAARRGWTILTLLTLTLTTIYQWGWVMRFLTESQLPLAMGVFLVFAVAGFATVAFRPRSLRGERDATAERSAMAAAAMPLLFAVYLASVPAYGNHPALLFGFLFLIAVALFAVAAATGNGVLHLAGAVASLVVFATWLATSYAHGAWNIAMAAGAAFVVLYAMAPMVARWVRRPIEDLGDKAIYTAPVLLFVFAAIARIEPAAAEPFRLFVPMLALLVLLGWRAIAEPAPGVYYVAALFAVVSEAAWSATHLTAPRLGSALILYGAFTAFYLGVPIVARRTGRPLEPSWGGGAVLVAALLVLLSLATGPISLAAMWGLALLLAILNAGVFVESAATGLPMIALVGSVLSWLVLGVWWSHAAAAVGVLPSLLVLVCLTLTMLGGYAWAGPRQATGFQYGVFLALVGHAFLWFVAVDAHASIPPWPLFGALAVITLATSAASIATANGELHAAGLVASALVAIGWTSVAPASWSATILAAAEAIAGYGLLWAYAVRRRAVGAVACAGAGIALFVTEVTIVSAGAAMSAVPLAVIAAAHAVNVSAILALAWIQEWQWVAVAAVLPAWNAFVSWHSAHAAADAWSSGFILATVIYAVFTAYPFVLGRRTAESREPYSAAIAGAAFYFFAARIALLQGGLDRFVGVVPVGEGIVMALLLRRLLAIEPREERDLGRLALVAGAALAFATVAIPLQLRHQWITLGWALEGVALAWMYRRIPHRGLMLWSTALLAVVFVRLALNPSIFYYEPRGYRLINWYLYTYLTCGVSLLAAAWLLSSTEDHVASWLPRVSSLMPVGGVVLLFLLLNIEIADYYAIGPEVTFRFGVSLAQDLTYTIGWLVFGLALLSACIYLHSRPGRIAAVAMIAITTFKAFLYDMGSLGGLYRVGSLIGLAASLSLVALALQKYVLQESHPR